MEFTDALAVLGVYFALMAVLAVGVETIIGWLKLPWSRLQGKPSPDEVSRRTRFTCLFEPNTRTSSPLEEIPNCKLGRVNFSSKFEIVIRIDDDHLRSIVFINLFPLFVYQLLSTCTCHREQIIKILIRR